MLHKTALLLCTISLCATAASAQQVYTLTGRFTRSFGLAYNIPLVGHTPCGGLTLMSGPNMKTIPAPITPATHPMTRGANTLPAALPPMTGAAIGFDLGCLRGAGQVTTPGTGIGGSFVLPANAFAQGLPAASTPHVVPIKYVTAVKQATTSLSFMAPTAPALFQASAWASQAGRAAPNFTWCPGNPACVNIVGGSRELIVKYTAGPNRFGGTIGLVIAAGPNPSRLVLQGAAGITFLPIVSAGLRPTGRGYAVKHTDPSAFASAWAMAMQTPMGRISMGTTYLGPRPFGGTRVNYGFPFTTGRVLVRNTGTDVGNPMVTTLTAEGGDTVTPMGVRNISLVAGGVAAYWKGAAPGAEVVGLNQILLPEPGAPLQTLAGAIGLLAIAAWRALRLRAT